MKTEEQFETTTIRTLTNVWCAVLLLAGLLTTSLASAQTLKFRFNFEDTGTTTTDTASGVMLNMVNSSSVATDYHGAAGTGVGGAGKALNLTSGADGGTGPIVSTVNNATLGLGSVSSWTVTEWVNPSATSASLAALIGARWQPQTRQKLTTGAGTGSTVRFRTFCSPKNVAEVRAGRYQQGGNHAENLHQNPIDT